MSTSKIGVLAWLRGLTTLDQSEGREDVQLQVNNRGDTIVALGLPALSELVRMGNSWQSKTTTGQAALTALPTTTAGFTIYNGEVTGGKSYLIESFGSWEAVIDATQADTTAIFAMLSEAPLATVPTDAALNIASLSGKPSYTGRARTVAGGTVINDAGWYPHGPQAVLAPAVAAANWKVNECMAKGLYLVPPGGAFNIVAVKAAAAAAAQQFYFVRWHEVQLIVNN